jgi:hypothetical protein
MTNYQPSEFKRKFEDNATPESDRKVRELLEALQISVEGAIALLPPQ